MAGRKVHELAQGTIIRFSVHSFLKWCSLLPFCDPVQTWHVSVLFLFDAFFFLSSDIKIIWLENVGFAPYV